MQYTVSSRWILNVTDSTDWVAQRRSQLSGFEFDVVFRAVIERLAVEALLGLHTLIEDTSLFRDDLPFLGIDAHEENNSHVCVIHTNRNEAILLNSESDDLLNTHFTKR